MQTATINGFQVVILKGFDGTQLFISNPEGFQIYAHRVSGDAMERAKAIIALETPEVIESVDKMICLSARKEEFQSAMLRGLENNLVVERDTERDSFFVVNTTKSTDYRVRLETRDGLAHAECECADFQNRRRICKHISEVLQESFFGVTETFGVTLS